MPLSKLDAEQLLRIPMLNNFLDKTIIIILKCGLVCRSIKPEN